MTSACYAIINFKTFFNSHPHKEDDINKTCTPTRNWLFNSHPHKEDDLSILYGCTSTYFSTHILTRRMTIDIVYIWVGWIFQLTSSQGGWRRAVCSAGGWKIFNSHPHKEDDASSDIAWIFVFLFQLTSSQGGWRFVRHCMNLCISFSTHILTRRMTERTRNWQKRNSFQLTSSQGGWRFPVFVLVHQSFFNSHPHKEDDIAAKHNSMPLHFSTHILTRRMTLET